MTTSNPTGISRRISTGKPHIRLRGRNAYGDLIWEIQKNSPMGTAYTGTISRLQKDTIFWNWVCNVF